MEEERLGLGASAGGKVKVKHAVNAKKKKIYEERKVSKKSTVDEWFKLRGMLCEKTVLNGHNGTHLESLTSVVV